METRQPYAWSALGSALPRLAAPDPRYPSEPQWTVLLWDPCPARRQCVSRLIAACGARPRCNEEVSAIPHIESSRTCALAVVALGACPAPDDLGVEAIRSLKQKGFRVLCYADGAPSWPLSVRCQLLEAIRKYDLAKEYLCSLVSAYPISIGARDHGA